MSSISVGLIRTGYYELQSYGGTYYKAWIPGANSAGGVGVKLTVKNLSGKTIKYLRFSLKPYNRVNDAVGSEFSHQNRTIFEYTGPLKPKKTEELYWENAWYNNTIVKARIRFVEIEYMDGQIEKLKRRDIEINKKLGKKISPIGLLLGLLAIGFLTIGIVVSVYAMFSFY